MQISIKSQIDIFLKISKYSKDIAQIVNYFKNGVEK